MANKSMFRDKHVGLGLLLLIIATFASVGDVSAITSYNTTLQSVYGNASCGICHIDPDGGGNRTAYGMMFESHANHMTNASAALLAIGAPPAMGTLPKLTLILSATMDSGNATANNFTKVVLRGITGDIVAIATLPNNRTAEFDLSDIVTGDYFIEVNDLAGDRIPTRIDDNTSDINQSVGMRLRNSIIGDISDPTYRIKARSGGAHPIVNYTTGANESEVAYIIVSTSPAKIEIREINTSRELSSFTPISAHPITGDTFQTWIIGSENHGIKYNDTDASCNSSGCHGNLSEKVSNFSDIATNNGWCYRCHYSKSGDRNGFVDPTELTAVDNIAPTTILSGASEGETLNDNATISLVATDNTGGSGVNETFYTVNGGENITYIKPFIVNSTGQNNVTYWSTDNANNVEPQNIVNFTIAEVAPLNFKFTVTPQSVTVVPGKNATFNLRIDNVGNSADTYDFAIDNPSKANVAIAEDNISVDMLQSGNMAMIINSMVNGTFLVNVTATSRANNSNSATIYTKTIVNATVPTTGGKLSGEIFNDLNKNKFLDSGEAGIANMPVTLKGTGKSTKGIHMSTKTDTNGNYQFSNLKPGRYVIHSKFKHGWRSTTKVTKTVLKIKNGQTVVANFGKTKTK